MYLLHGWKEAMLIPCGLMSNNFVGGIRIYQVLKGSLVLMTVTTSVVPIPFLPFSLLIEQLRRIQIFQIFNGSLVRLTVTTSVVPITFLPFSLLIEQLRRIQIYQVLNDSLVR